MPATIQEIYTQIIRTLPPADRFRLAKLILNDLVQQDTDLVEQSDSWTEQDQIDLLDLSLQYATTAYPDTGELSECP